MVISERIQTLGNFICEGEKVADIGADHGLLELYVLGKRKNVFITAVENKKGPYAILDRTLRGLKNVQLSLSDGLDEIDETHNTVVIAGMGGLNIKKIIEANKEKISNINKFIIDAHRDIDVVRKTLIKYGYKIDKEKIVLEDEKFYVVNCFIKVNEKQTYSKDEIEFGYELYKDELWPLYKKNLIKRNNETIAKISGNQNNQNKILKLKKLNERLEHYGKN